MKELSAGLLLIAIFLSPVAAYFTHLYWTVTTLFGEGVVEAKEIALMAFGVFMPPIGVIHGFVIWF